MSQQEAQLMFNSLAIGDTILRHRTWSTLVQVMACCLMAPSHYLNQCWLVISEVLWNWPESNFTGRCLSLIWFWRLPIQDTQRYIVLNCYVTFIHLLHILVILFFFSNFKTQQHITFAHHHHDTTCQHIEAVTKWLSFADDIFKCSFFNENIRIAIKIWWYFVPKGPNDNNSALIWVMAWCHTRGQAITWTSDSPEDVW